MVLHRWTALVAGIVLVLTALSGAVLVFEGAIDRGLHPELWRVRPAATALPIDTVVARVEAKFAPSKVASIAIAPAANRAWTTSVDSLTVFVDPYTGAIKGTRTPSENATTLSRRLHVFHVELFAGRRGRALVGATSVVALFLALTGIILWWPDKVMRVRTNASWKRINFDLHHLLGISAALILIAIAASGVLIHYDGLSAKVRSLDAVPPPNPKAQSAGGGAAPRRSFDAIAATAQNALPGARILFIATAPPKAPINVAMRFPEDHTPGGRSRVVIDRYTGEVLGVRSTRDVGVGTQIDNLKRSIHTGDVFGKPSEAVWFLASIVMAAQAVTGALMWWNAQRGRFGPLRVSPKTFVDNARLQT